MIADIENPAKAVYLDGKRVDLTITTMADDERGVIEQLVIALDDSGHRTIKRGAFGQPVTVERRGDVRIIFPDLPKRPH